MDTKQDMTIVSMDEHDDRARESNEQSMIKAQKE
jgi:hypothetical protein